MDTPSKAVRFAELIKGLLYLILAISIIVAVVLGQTGVIITLEDIIENLIIAWFGKIVLVIIAIALFIYAFKQLRVIK